ncbi:DUF6233 domain-containing protein [Streptomyces mirabilis]|uniref:DUF6233 domain-containing protein n=1 Tax=Streptomyces mirabilis TaxID=68239 RepID=UPI00382FB418
MTCRLTWHDSSPFGCGTPCGCSASTPKSPPYRSGKPNRNRARRTVPQEPDWIIELGIGNGRPPIEVHVGGCYAAGKRRRPVPRDEARRLLTSGVRACTHCTPGAQLRILD